MIDMKVTKLFFDKAKVLKAVDDANVKSLSRSGAIVRTIMQRLIRRRKKTAQPGTPPSSHTDLLRKFIFFSYDPSSKSCVVGPALTKGGGSPTVPQVLDEGGVRNGVLYNAFPFKGPALDASTAKIAESFGNSIEG